MADCGPRSLPWSRCASPSRVRDRACRYRPLASSCPAGNRASQRPVSMVEVVKSCRDSAMTARSRSSAQVSKSQADGACLGNGGPYGVSASRTWNRACASAVARCSAVSRMACVSG